MLPLGCLVLVSPRLLPPHWTHVFREGALVVCLSLRSELSPGRQQGPWFIGSVCSLLRWGTTASPTVELVQRAPPGDWGHVVAESSPHTCTARLTTQLGTAAARRLQFGGLIGKAGGNAGEAMENREPPTLLVGMYIWCSHCGNSVEIPQKMLEKSYLLIQQSHYWIYF